MADADTASSSGNPSRPRISMPSVLIADDAAFMRMMLKNVLTEAGFEVVGEAENGAVAVARYRELNPDLTTMDITMPEMDGLAALREIREQDPGARVVMCSAMGQQSMVIESIQAGARDFIVKPFQPDRVVEAVQKALA
jgi:two-component system chemotaxis response regulator CheY